MYRYTVFLLINLVFWKATDMYYIFFCFETPSAGFKKASFIPTEFSHDKQNKLRSFHTHSI